MKPIIIHTIVPPCIPLSLKLKSSNGLMTVNKITKEYTNIKGFAGLVICDLVIPFNRSFHKFITLFSNEFEVIRIDDTLVR